MPVVGESIPTHPVYWIIVSDDGPAKRPRQHTTIVEAATEAERLSKANPGKHFTVYAAVTDRFVVPSPAPQITNFADPYRPGPMFFGGRLGPSGKFYPY
jgi:ABC-type nitrate/sulfonate/bicarbonate transport system substrate-binding protein